MVRLNPKKADAFQDIQAKVLENSLYSYSETLKQTFNDTVIHCEFPDQLKKADIKPVFKAEDHT